MGYGRISRNKYLKLNLIIILIGLLLMWVYTGKLLLPVDFVSYLSFVFIFLTIPLFILPLVRLRFHDRGESFGKYLLYLIIIIICGKLLDTYSIEERVKP